MTSWPLAMQLAGEVPARPCRRPTMTTYIRPPPPSGPTRGARASRSRSWSGRRCAGPARRTRRARAGSSTRTTTLVDLEAPLGDLGDDQVGVVAVGGGDEHVGALDAGLQQRVDLERGADRELAAASSQAPSSPRRGARARAGPRRGPRRRGRRRARAWRWPTRRAPRPRSGRTSAGL